ncbi:uncharacterized protein G2W53_015042 [Senna tora]|uniref:Uncharacterized protein n=1 Tax=Senna tora TaxID=362788 RepID=A0A835C504_9FABA|nr:uncharacterized protein G2W53_015042 [Senna tora]
MATGQISRRCRLVAVDLAEENAEVLRESEGGEASAATEEEVFVLEPLKHSHQQKKLSPSKEDPWPPDRSLGAVVSLHQISRRHHLVPADLAGENAEVLRESEGEEASAAAKEEVFGLERQKLSPSKEDPWPPERSLGALVLLHQISRRCCLIEAYLAGENGEVLRESEGEEASAVAEEEVFRLERQKLSPSKEDPWPPDRSLGAVVSLHQISRRRRLVAADLAEENAEMLRDSEGEEASAAREEEVFGLEFIGRFSLSRSTSQTLSSTEKTLAVEGGSMATGQISRHRRLVAADLAGENAEVLWESEGEEASSAAEEEVFDLEEDPCPPDRSLGAVVSLHQISRRRHLVAADLSEENAKVLRESEGEEASAAAEEEVFGLEVSEGNLLLYSV